ncbi:MAG: DUF2796 domain-containing protein [Gammaproteobacteria bacterium]|nr:DUF2796 domain-containing protein [Gammaproteobacteria bacterium]MCP5426064.1 DUF2796 domain-containing protein [Gammaproteobacteria bacterium]
MFKTTPLLAGLASLCLASQPLLAAEETVHQHGAHVHGVAQLNVVLEDGRLDMEFTTPAANIVGFEHPPRTAEEHQALSKTIGVLNAPGQLFSLPSAAACRNTETVVDASMLGHETHDQDTKEDEHPDDAHHHEDGHHGSERHAEIHADYSFQCSAPEKLDVIDVLIFQYFPATQEIEVQRIGPQGQGGQKLTAKAARLTL